MRKKAQKDVEDANSILDRFDGDDWWSSALFRLIVTLLLLFFLFCMSMFPNPVIVLSLQSSLNCSGYILLLFCDHILYGWSLTLQLLGRLCATSRIHGLTYPRARRSFLDTYLAPWIVPRQVCPQVLIWTAEDMDDDEEYVRPCGIHRWTVGTSPILCWGRKMSLPGRNMGWVIIGGIFWTLNYAHASPALIGFRAFRCHFVWSLEDRSNATLGSQEWFTVRILHFFCVTL